ncbi:uncharacterized protein LOC124888812 [Capsicum annuum]|uniref:uncharacterized protein LOC124888812 n=1 Tax=Capsicum annuum TaxID=4072 RepID=UPI001FB05D3C|nr:uncharacterized protein LOC124888812 [Capsicum annuum]
MVTSWILNFLSNDTADSVEYVSDALELWTELEDPYDQTNGAKQYQIQKKINDFIQEAHDITTYYTRLKKLWEELSNLNVKDQCSCTCTCGAKKASHKAEQDRRLMQFLMGLDEVYIVIRGSILMMNPFPSMGQVFAILIQEEKQRELKPNNQMFPESSSFMAGTSSLSRGRELRTNYSSSTYSSYPSNKLPNEPTSSSNFSNTRNFWTNYSVSNHPSSSKNRPFCEYCKKLGHTKEKCYKLHGYPNPIRTAGPTSQHYPNNGNRYSTSSQYFNQGSRSNNGNGTTSANSVKLSCDSAIGYDAEFGCAPAHKLIQ